MKLQTHVIERWLNNQYEMNCVINEGEMPNISIESIPRVMRGPIQILDQQDVASCSSSVSSTTAKHKIINQQTVLSKIRALKAKSATKSTEHEEHGKSSTSVQVMENEESEDRANDLNSTPDKNTSIIDKIKLLKTKSTLKIKSNASIQSTESSLPQFIEPLKSTLENEKP